MNKDSIDWLYGLSAPMVALNKDNGASYTSAYFIPERNFVDLSESWGITSRQTLLNCVFDMVDNGHSPLLSHYYSIYCRSSESDWRNYCQNQDDYQKVLLEFVEQTFCVCGIGGIRSWDYARMAYILRNGTTNKYITEEEALWILTKIAARSQYFYKSWRNYFAGWSVGFQFWESFNNKENLEALRCELTRASQTRTMKILISDEDSPCNRLPWYIDIKEREKPESLREYDWS